MSIPDIRPIMVPEPDRMGQIGNLMNMVVAQRFVDNVLDRMGTLGKAKSKKTDEEKAKEVQELEEKNRGLNFLADKTQRIEEKIAEQKRIEDHKAMGMWERLQNPIKHSSLKYFRNLPPKESLKDQLLTLQKQEDEFQKALTPTKDKKPPSDLDFYMNNPEAWERQKQIEAINKVLNPPSEPSKVEPSKVESSKAKPSKAKPSKPPRKKEINPLELSMRITAFNQNRNQ